MIRTALALMLLPATLTAGDLAVENAMVPLAPPGVTAHAAYLTLTNSGAAPRQLIGVSAQGYMTAHIHKTEVENDIASMSSVDLLEIAPGQSIAFDQGGLHIMLMRPSRALQNGDTVDLRLEFANGETLPVTAKVMPRADRAHSHGS